MPMPMLVPTPMLSPMPKYQTPSLFMPMLTPPMARVSPFANTYQDDGPQLSATQMFLATTDTLTSAALTLAQDVKTPQFGRDGSREAPRARPRPQSRKEAIWNTFGEKRCGLT